MTGSEQLPVCMCAVRRSAVAKIIITSDGKSDKEIELDKERMTIGRKAYNDIILEDRAVSGQHANISLMLNDAVLEDLGSTNGTFIAGNKVYRQKLVDGDTITIANFTLTFVASPPNAQPHGQIEVISGAHAGKRLSLSKPLTTIGKPGEAVVAIVYTSGIYAAAKIVGEMGPSINGVELEDQPRSLSDGDMLDLAGTRMKFVGK